MDHALNHHLLRLLAKRAAHVEAELPWSGASLSDGLALLYSPQDPEFLRLQAQRDCHQNPDVRAQGEALDRDLVRLIRGWRPTSSDLYDAPLMAVSDVFVSLAPGRFSLSLVGPVLDASGAQISNRRITSLLVAADAHACAWVRTFNRFYRVAPIEHPSTHNNTNGDLI